MFSFKSIVLIVAAVTIGAECSAVPAIAATPLAAPAHIGYAHAVPQNIPPYASQVNFVNRALRPLVAAPAVAAPLAAPLPAPVAPFAPAPYFAGPASAPYFAGQAPALPAPFGLPAAYAAAPAPYAAPYSYSAPLFRSPYGFAPAYVR